MPGYGGRGGGGRALTKINNACCGQLSVCTFKMSNLLTLKNTEYVQFTDVYCLKIL